MKTNNTRLRKIVHFSDLYIASNLKSTSYNYVELIALYYIRKKETTSQEMLVKLLLVDKSSITKMLNRFEKEGLITRTPDPLDMRYRIIVATKKLVETELSSPYFEDEFYAHMLEDCTPEEVELFYNIMTRMYYKAKRAYRDNFTSIKHLDLTTTDIPE
ncbi:MAG: MarR family winged helix-turn-helix transcriptional regulator [Clostridia bacterium]